MKNSFLRESYFEDKSEIPKTFKDFQKQEIEALLQEHPDIKKEDIISYYVHDKENIPIETQDEYKIMKDKNKKKIYTVRKVDFRPNLVIEQQTFDEQQLETEPSKIEKKFNEYLSDAKSKIELILKQKEEAIIEKKKDLLKKVNEIAQVEEGKPFNDLLIRNYFEEELYNEFKKKLNIVLTTNQSDAIEGKSIKCSFCNQVYKGQTYKSEIMKKDEYCERCFLILSQFYPCNYSKVLN